MVGQAAGSGVGWVGEGLASGRCGW
jgi:hypothetical protein